MYMIFVIFSLPAIIASVYLFWRRLIDCRDCYTHWVHVSTTDDTHSVCTRLVNKTVGFYFQWKTSWMNWGMNKTTTKHSQNIFIPTSIQMFAAVCEATSENGTLDCNWAIKVEFILQKKETNFDGKVVDVSVFMFWMVIFSQISFLREQKLPQIRAGPYTSSRSQRKRVKIIKRPLCLTEEIRL